MQLFISYLKTKMKKEAKEKTVECNRKESIVRDIVAYVVVAYVAVLAFLVVDAKVKLANAQTELISNNIAVSYNMN